MSATPSVFRPVRANDVHIRPFKAYKNYFVTNLTGSTCTPANTASAYYARTALHNTDLINTDDPTSTFLLNTDGSDQNIEWRSLDHRFYRYPYDWARCSELTNPRTNYKFLFYSASTLAIPYLDAGERIKPNSVRLEATVSGQYIDLIDDGYGSLRDPLIITSSFASASYCRMYYTFNDEFRRFNTNFGLNVNKDIKFIRGGVSVPSIVRNVDIQPGVTLVNGTTNIHNSGLSGYFDGQSYIRLADNDIYKRFNHCDRWTISFWLNPDSASIAAATSSAGTILSKGSVVKEWQAVPNMTNTGTVMGYADTVYNRPNPFTGDWTNYKTPMEVSVGTALDVLYVEYGYVSSSYVESLASAPALMFRCSDGISSTEVRAPISGSEWQHYAIVYDGSLVSIYRNGSSTGIAASMPKYATVNAADIMIGATDTNYKYGYKGNIAELRFYDYTVSDIGIQSLANRHFLSASLYQTNVGGNVFYRNEQIVVTSPLSKYNSGSGLFANEWKLNYRGQRTLYENEVMVRIPSDAMNISMNPTATYRRGSGIDNNCNTAPMGSGAEQYNEPGEFRLQGFLSGSMLPYITTVGLYNPQGQLLVIGKLAQAVQKRDDVPTNIILRWDY